MLLKKQTILSCFVVVARTSCNQEFRYSTGKKRGQGRGGGVYKQGGPKFMFWKEWDLRENNRD